MDAPLPIVDGVGPSCQWLPAGRWKTISDFLNESFPHVEATTWSKRMQRGQLVDEMGIRVTPTTAYRAGACIYYYRELEKERVIPFVEQVLYQDEHILVVDKPPFLPVMPAGKFLQQTLLVRLRKRQLSDYLAPIHRIDRETSGLVIFSVNQKTAGRYTALFRDRLVIKTYEALAPTLEGASFPIIHRSRIVEGDPFFRVREVAGDPNSETHVTVLAGKGMVDHYQLRPLTGKKHQLRIHLAALGIPIINDKFYPELVHYDEDDFSTPLKLLAKSISFADPFTGRRQHFESSGNL